MDIFNKGTDSNALGSYWFTLNVDTSALPEGQTIQKVEIVCGNLRKIITTQSFPVEVNLSVEESRILKCGKNTVYLYGYDGTGKRFKFDGFYEFIAKQED